LYFQDLQKQTLDVYLLGNKTVACVMSDADCWLLGEKQENMPLNYCGEDAEKLTFFMYTELLKKV
jgi:hypothetical protein